MCAPQPRGGTRPAAPTATAPCRAWGRPGGPSSHHLRRNCAALVSPVRPAGLELGGDTSWCLLRQSQDPQNAPCGPPAPRAAMEGGEGGGGGMPSCARQHAGTGMGRMSHRTAAARAEHAAGAQAPRGAWLGADGASTRLQPRWGLAATVPPSQPHRAVGAVPPPRGPRSAPRGFAAFNPGCGSPGLEPRKHLWDCAGQSTAGKWP